MASMNAPEANGSRGAASQEQDSVNAQNASIVVSEEAAESGRMHRRKRYKFLFVNGDGAQVAEGKDGRAMDGHWNSRLIVAPKGVYKTKNGYRVQLRAPGPGSGPGRKRQRDEAESPTHCAVRSQSGGKFSRNTKVYMEAVWLYEVAVLISDQPVSLQAQISNGNFDSLVSMGWIRDGLHYLIELVQQTSRLYSLHALRRVERDVAMQLLASFGAPGLASNGAGTRSDNGCNGNDGGAIDRSERRSNDAATAAHAHARAEGTSCSGTASAAQQLAATFGQHHTLPPAGYPHSGMHGDWASYHHAHPHLQHIFQQQRNLEHVTTFMAGAGGSMFPFGYPQHSAPARIASNDSSTRSGSDSGTENSDGDGKGAMSNVEHFAAESGASSDSRYPGASCLTTVSAESDRSVGQGSLLAC